MTAPIASGHTPDMAAAFPDEATHAIRAFLATARGAADPTLMAQAEREARLILWMCNEDRKLIERRRARGEG